MNGSTYSDGSNVRSTDTQFVEIFSNKAISCIATHDMAKQLEALTKEERAEMKGFFTYYRNHPYIYQGTDGYIACVVSDRTVRADYFAKMQYKNDSQIAVFTILKLDIKN
jgi:hypothetical protein